MGCLGFRSVSSAFASASFALPWFPSLLVIHIWNRKTIFNCFPVLGVGFDLFSRLVAKQVFSALQRLTSVFGMGTGGPSALRKPTRLSFPQALLCQRWPIFPARRQASIFGTAELNFCVRNGNRWTLCVKSTDYWCTFRDSNPGPTD